jgi:uncharacterized protein (TIGR03382 family)
MMVALAPEASAHFVLDAPPAYSVQNALGLPEKSAPCGQADPGTPVVPTNVVTPFHAGDMITVTIDEKVFHPGHYRVALATDQSQLPPDPMVTVGATPCGSAQIEDATTPGVLADNMLAHTAAFSAPQSFQVQLPAGMTCTNCTLQVIEFMSDHPLNNPGGCFYHHCAQISLFPPGTPLPDAGTGSGSGKPHGGCDASGASGAAAWLMLGLFLLRGRRLASRPRADYDPTYPRRCRPRR